MSMTVVVTRNVSPRMRGFLASTMLELAPGVYSAPRLSPAVRARIWAVLEEWFAYEQDTSMISSLAYAGIDPRRLGDYALARKLPRTRGDRPSG
ncbi:type I-E CRISPR-associated endoribonuclease Cas2e [Methylothermus subterraneus]